MYLFTSVILILILAIILLLSFIPLKIYLNANSTDFPRFNILFSWLYPFFKGTIICDENASISLNIYFFKKLIKTKPIKFKNDSNINKINFIKNCKLNSINIKTSYGFKDPWITGLICGIINSLPSVTFNDEILNYPNFTTEATYFHTVGRVQVNLLSLLVQLLKSKFSNSSKNISYANK